MRIKAILCLLIFVPLLLSGCMYPNQNLTINQTAYKDQLQSVQNAVDAFRKDNDGILPIKTMEASTPIYQKYPIDFKKLIPKYLAEPPGNAYENGGIFEYVLVDTDANPTVKLVDLRIAEAIQEIKFRIEANGYPPFEKRLSYSVYTLNFKKLGYETPPYAVSPFSNNNLPFIITSDAQVYVDYKSDLYEALKKNHYSIKSGEDIRSILSNNSMFVPAYSLPYTVDPKTDEPIFLENKHP